MNAEDVATDGATERIPAPRSTRQRRAVQAAMEESNDFRSAQEIHDALRRRGDAVGLATVYRNLQALADSGDLDVVKTDGGESVYRRCSRSHHHHLVCRSCGRTIEIEGPAVETWAASLAAQHDYADVSHTVELFGTCPDCASGA